MKTILFFILFTICLESSAQYIAVRARYTATRLVDDAPNPPKRENRLVLSFYTVTVHEGNYTYTPVALANYDLWINKSGLQYGNMMGGLFDSTGNNYPGYSYTAPKVVSYYNTLGLNYIDCHADIATHYVVNGTSLDVGFVTVSYWDTEGGTLPPYEVFRAPNLCLPYYDFTHPYYINPGNVNFYWGVLFPSPPDNLYNFHCGGPLQLVMRGLLPEDTGNINTPLPIRFANARATIDDSERVTVAWSNLTETDIHRYEVERSVDGGTYSLAGVVFPSTNNGGRADYTFYTQQTSERAYYRIKGVETTGDELYSSVLLVTNVASSIAPRQSLDIFPNPVSGHETTIRLSNAPAGRYVCSVLSAEGIAVRQQVIHHASGDLIRRLEWTGLTHGVYRVVLWSLTHRYTQTFLYAD
jgi:hypothetical protein